MKEQFEMFLGKRIKVDRIDGFFYVGTLKRLTEDGLWIDDRKNGLMFISYDAISSLGGDKE